MKITLVPQNAPGSIPLTFGDAVLVSIQEVFLPLISKMLGHRDHAAIQAILEGLDEMSELISWNQSIWIPEKFGKFLREWVFGADSVSAKYSEYIVPENVVLSRDSYS